jgi:hypothetical protein
MTTTRLEHREAMANIPEKSAFEFPFGDSGGRDTAALESYEQSHPLKVGVIRFHRFDHERSCRIYTGEACDCAVIVWVLDVPLAKMDAAQELITQVFGRRH